MTALVLVPYFLETVDGLVIDPKLLLPIVTETADTLSADETNEVKSQEDEACYGCDDAEARLTLGFAANAAAASLLASSPPSIPIAVGTYQYWTRSILGNYHS